MDNKAVNLSVLMITSQYPSDAKPYSGVFVKRQADFLKKYGVKIDVHKFNGQKNPLNYFIEWFKVRKKINSNKYNLIHCQFGQSGLLAIPKKLPLVVTFRGSEVQGIITDMGKKTLTGRILRFISSYVAKRATKVIVVSRALVGKLPPGLNYEIIPSGIDLDKFFLIPKTVARNKLGLPLDKKLILFGGTKNNPIKRYNLALKAFNELKKIRADVEFVLMENKPHSDIVYFMNSCDVLLLTSTQEGSPNVIKEALACNLPIVSLEVGDVKERIKNLPWCRLNPDENPVTIAKNLHEVLSWNGKTDSREAVKEISEEKQTKKLLKIYNSLTE